MSASDINAAEPRIFSLAPIRYTLGPLLVAALHERPAIDVASIMTLLVDYGSAVCRHEVSNALELQETIRAALATTYVLDVTDSALDTLLNALFDTFTAPDSDAVRAHRRALIRDALFSPLPRV